MTDITGPPEPFSDECIVDAWHDNARPWIEAVRGGAIESRRRVTDRAIVDVVRRSRPRTLLDIGCGEGWLVRALARHDVQALGVDVVPELIEAATQAGGGRFRVLSYEAIAAGALSERFDAVVCNFSLLGEASVARLLRAVPALLNAGGQLIVQTLHPLVACGGLPYQDGWLAGSWAGIDGDFAAPAPWYFRTLGGWIDLLAASGLQLCALREPLHPDSAKPASVILVARPAGG